MVALSSVLDWTGSTRIPADWAILTGEDGARRGPGPVSMQEAHVPSERSASDPASPASRPAPVASLAAAVGALDVLVLRRVREHEWLHTGGTAAATSAPSSVDDDPGTSPHLARALSGHPVVRVLAGAPVPVVGAYWATTAALVRVADDAVVVLGHPGRSEALMGASDAALVRAAGELAARGDGAEDGGDEGGAEGRPVSPVVELREELAVLQAVHALTASLDQPVPVAMERLAAALAGVLDAALVLVWSGAGAEHTALVTGPALAPVEDARALALAWSAHLPGRGRPPLTGGHRPAGAPGAGLDGPWLAVGLDVAGGGGILALRAGPEPFGARVQRAAGELATTAASLLQVALARQEVERQLSDTRLQLGRDSLTSASSRHHWDAELAAAQDLVDSGVPVCVALLDLDDLKWVNDTHGHPAGDELLRTCADAVRSCLRGGSDVVARVGGDEFAVLVPRAIDAASLTQRLRRGVESARTSIGVALRVSVGVALCEPGQRVADAFAAADSAMYEDKRERRAVRGRAPV